MFGRDFADEAAGDAAHPLAVDAAVRGVIDARALAGAGDRDIGEAAFFLEAGGAAFVHRTLRGEDAVFPAGADNMIELATLGVVDRHDRLGLGLVVLVSVPNAANMFDEFHESLLFLYRAHDAGEIVARRGAHDAGLCGGPRGT